MTAGYPSELDRWRAAQQLITRYGEGAEQEAANLAKRAIEPDAERLWLDVLGKVRALQSSKAPAGKLN